MRQRAPKILTAIAFLSLACALGCGSRARVVYVPEGAPVRLAEDVSARVWVKDASGQWVKSANRVTLSEGWYALSDAKAGEE